MNTPFMPKQNRLRSKNRRVYFTYLFNDAVSFYTQCRWQMNEIGVECRIDGKILAAENRSTRGGGFPSAT